MCRLCFKEVVSESVVGWSEPLEAPSASEQHSLTVWGTRIHPCSPFGKDFVSRRLSEGVLGNSNKCHRHLCPLRCPLILQCVLLASYRMFETANLLLFIHRKVMVPSVS